MGVLPNVVYIKQGHNPRKPNKPAYFCHTQGELLQLIQRFLSKNHIIVESNISELSFDKVIRIFIDGIKGKTNFRKDSEILKQKADIYFGEEWDEIKTRNILIEHLSSTPLAEKILQIFRAIQKHFTDEYIHSTSICEL